MKRRIELTRYARTSLVSPALIDRLHSALEDIEKRSQALLEKGVAARFVDKDGDSKDVARLIERLREAISHYQVSGYQILLSTTVDVGGQFSQQQAIYDQITDLTVRTLRLSSPLCR